MSDTPGNNSPPRDNRSGGGNRNHNRNRNRNRQGPPRGEGDRRRDGDRRDRPRDEHRPSRRDDRRGDGERRRDGDRRGPRPDRKPVVAAKPTFGQRLLTILTFGLVRPKANGRPPVKPKPKAPESPQTLRPPREPRQAVPPADPEAVDNERLHIGNLSYDATEDDLLGLFKGIGMVQSVDIVYNGRTHRSKGFGFVQMMSLADARRAVAELHGQSFMGRPLIIGPARSRGGDDREADTPEE